MAQAVNDQQQISITNDATLHVWPKSLILNQSYAVTFGCVKCKGIPKSCMNNSAGEILCKQCSKDMDGITPAIAVRNMINKLKTKCLSISQDTNNEQSEGSNLTATQISDQCDWTGSIQEYPEHDKECPYIVIQCDKCKSFKCQRKLLPDHLNQCPDVTINCVLSCGSHIIRKNLNNHLNNDCVEQLLDCTNDDCKIQIKRKDFQKHVNNECDTRIVECKFHKYGCNVQNIKANQLQKHLDQYKFEHISNQFMFTTNKLQKENEELKKRLDNVQKTVVPKGMIGMWSGSKDNIPDGWSLCDGNNGTPDLRNKFILSTDNGDNIGNNGGSKMHSHAITVNLKSLSINQIPAHYHGYGKRHRKTDDKGSYNVVEISNGGKAYATCKSGGSKPHTHGASSNVKNHMPPYYVLGFIMKL